jgi:hypothetical protein
MNWVVVGLNAFDEWSESGTDPDTRITVLEWLLGVQASGPPADGEFDPHRDTWAVTVPGTDVVAEYIIAPFLEPPAIVFRRFQSS